MALICRATPQLRRHHRSKHLSVLKHCATMEETAPPIQKRAPPASQSRLDSQLGPEYSFTRVSAGRGEERNLAAEEVPVLIKKIFGFEDWSSAIRDVQIDFVCAHGIWTGMTMIVTVHTGRRGSGYWADHAGTVNHRSGDSERWHVPRCVLDKPTRLMAPIANMLGNRLRPC